MQKKRKEGSPTDVNDFVGGDKNPSGIKGEEEQSLCYFFLLFSPLRVFFSSSEPPSARQIPV